MKIHVQEKSIRKKFRLPPLGLRIRKTGIAVFLCLLIYYLRGYKGLVSQSCVAAIICMQPFRKDIMQQGIERIVGTILGAFWGLLFLEMLDRLPFLTKSMLLVYIIMALGVVVTLYSTVLFNQTNTAALAAIVFLGTVITYPAIEAPFSQTYQSLIDTIIGIVVAGFVDAYERPRTKHPEYVFFVRLQDLVPDRYSHVASQILVSLNRLYEEGARISLVSRWAPAFLLSQMGTMNINLPVIVMAGAAMYDIPNKQYMNAIPVSQEDTDLLAEHLLEICGGYCLYTVRESNMFVYRRGEMNAQEEDDYIMMKRSPYRNYVYGDPAPEDQICFIRVIAPDEVINEYEQKLLPLIPDTLRMEKRKQPRMNQCSGLYFFNANATIENQKANLIQYLKDHGEHGLVPVDMISQDGYLSIRDALHLLRKLRDIYEPPK